MITIKSKEELNYMRQAGKILSEVFKAVEVFVKPGITTADLDKIAYDYIIKHNAKPSFLNYGGFPKSICASVNDEVVHGIPSKKRILHDGDIVTVDVGACFKGYHADAARTYAVGNISDEAKRLMKVTEECFFKGVALAREGNHIGDISNAVQQHAESNGFSVVRDLVGHGVGAQLHEDPNVPNFGKPGKGPKLKAGMTLAVEPMINEGTYQVWQLDDGWTIVTQDGMLSAQYENTIIITKDECEIITL